MSLHLMKIWVAFSRVLYPKNASPHNSHLISAKIIRKDGIYLIFTKLWPLCQGPTCHLSLQPFYYLPFLLEETDIEKVEELVQV